MAKPNNFKTKDEEITFNLIDENTVKRLIKDGDISLPPKKIHIRKDERWNTQQMASKLMQGLLAGDNINTIAKSLGTIIGNNIVSQKRNARTMFTGAECRGRIDSYKELEEKGVIQKKVWIATSDDRTRESHAEIDGEEVDIDEPFSNGLMFPGDTSGEPEEVWNCRCSIKTKIVGFKKADGSIVYIEGDRDTTLHDEQIEEEKERRDEKDSQNSNSDTVTLEGLEKPERPPRLHREDFDTEEEYWKAEEKRDEELEEYKKKRDEYQEEVQRFIDVSLPEKTMSMSEMQDWCDNHNVKIYGDISKVDGRALTLYTERMDKLTSDFPEVMTYRENLPIPKEFQKYEVGFEDTIDYIAEASHGFTFGAEGKNLESMLGTQADDVASGYRVLGDGTINQLFDHEFGHNVQDAIQSRFERDSEGMMTRAGLESKSKMDKDLIDNVYGKTGMSEYASTNVNELFAEAFSAWYGGENTEFANAFGEFLERWR